MANFKERKAFMTRSSKLNVDAGLPEGEYRFQLVVVDSNDMSSEPVEVVVTIVPPRIGPLPIRPEPIRPGPVSPIPIRPGPIG
jgi:hypothetical protein